MNTESRHIDNTGERILLEKETPLMIARHFCAYIFSKDFVFGKRVLDMGCGEGYGSNYLAAYAGHVLGIDYDREIIDYAKDKYHKDNLDFSVLDIKDLDSLGKKFDVICSFQNIEHIQNTTKLLKDICNLLNEDGLFICSTCNIKDASPAGSSKPFNRFHVKEYSIKEFQELLGAHFGKLEIFGLNRGIKLKVYRRLKKLGVFRFLPKRINFVQKFYEGAKSTNFFWSKKNIDNALDFIAFCRKK